MSAAATTQPPPLADERAAAELAGGVLRYTRCPVPTPSGLAVGLGSLGAALAGHGLRLEALQDVPDPELRRRHFDHGAVDLVRDGGNIPAIWARASGVPTRLLGITWLDEVQALVVPADSPLRAVAELAGRRLALPVAAGSAIDVARASALRGFERAFAAAGLELSEAELVEVEKAPMTGPTSDGRGEDFAAELDLLVAGGADAAWVKGAGGLAEIRSRGLHEMFRFDTQPDPATRVNNGTPRTITARQELLDARPDVIASYLGALGEAQGAIGGEPDRLWQVLAAETHQDAAVAAEAYAGIAPDSLVPSLSAARLTALQSQADFLFEAGFAPARVDVAAWALEPGEGDDA